MSVEIRGGCSVVAVSGEVDLSNVHHLRQGIEQASDMAPEGFVIDLSEVTYIDSAGIAALMSAYRRVCPNGRLAIVAVHENVKGILSLINIDRLPGVHILHDIADAHKILHGHL